MNLAVIGCPIRAATLASRSSTCVWQSLISTPSHSAHRCRTYKSMTCRQQQSTTKYSIIQAQFYQKSLTQASVAARSPYIRYSSTSTTSAPSHDSVSTPHSSSKSPVNLDWNSFFTLRASRRKYSLVSSILASLTTTAVGAQVIASQNFETMGTQIMGFDPFIVLGLTTIACGAVGWLAGPVLGNGVWGLVYRKYKGAVAVKEKEFFDRIKRFRVDPSANSFANPVPDYYGEKIGSVQGYRQWLKDQRAYNRKKRNFV